MSCSRLSMDRSREEATTARGHPAWMGRARKKVAPRRSTLPGREKGLPQGKPLACRVERRVFDRPLAPEGLVRRPRLPVVERQKAGWRRRPAEQFGAPVAVRLLEEGDPGSGGAVRFGERGGLLVRRVELPEDLEHDWPRLTGECVRAGGTTRGEQA